MAEAPNTHIDQSATVNFCFLNPAWMPEWFWLPTAHAVAEKGADYFIPPLQRDITSTGIAQNVDIIDTTMQNKQSQYIVALSRGIEYAIRYIDRLDRQDRLADVLGWTVISSVGPRGYGESSEFAGIPKPRHTESYLAGITLNENGLEVLDSEAARSCLLHDLEDERLSDEIIQSLIKGRPLAPDEIQSVPYLQPNILPLTWYIGRNDEVDNIEASAYVAQHFFRVIPTYTDWGHIGPLTHIDQVADALLADAERARSAQETSI